MSQKANTITLRKDPTPKLITHNSRFWVSLYKFIESINRLFYLKGVWVVSNYVGVDNNCMFLNFKIYYQTSKFSLYKKRLSTLRTTSITLNKNKGFLRLTKKYENLYNTYVLKLVKLNGFLDHKHVKFLYLELRKYSSSIFPRRFNLFIDFLKMTSLFSRNIIDISYYVKVWSFVFKVLSKRVHNRFLRFAKHVFRIFLNRNSLKRNHYSDYIKGVKFSLSGRISGRDRSKTRTFSIGNVPIQTLDKRVDYGFSHVYTLYGTFGIKMWVSYDKKR